MSDLGTVSAYSPGDTPGCTVALTEADVAEGDLYASPGVDAPPLPGETCACMQITDGTGEFAIVGFAAGEAKAAPGERRVYARNGEGVTVAEAWLHGDGSITLEAGVDGTTPSSITLRPDGGIEGSGPVWSFEWSPLGALSITAPGGVSITGALQATTVGSALNDLDAHIHNQTVPPGPPPIPTTPPVPVPAP